MPTTASNQILDGTRLSRLILNDLKLQISTFKKTPTLAIVVATNDNASLEYVKMKQRKASKVGIKSELFNVNYNTKEVEIYEFLDYANKNNDIHGILVQHPLPSHINESNVLNSISVIKDVDGISPMSIGLLASKMPGHRAATPYGIMKLLEHYNIDLRGKNVTVVGCSIILGRPMALMLLEKDATVYITHKHTINLSEILKKSDIVISATGVAGLICANDIKDGAIVVDCGCSMINGKAVGDVLFEEVKERTSFITPVPGGVGPMTVATLLSNVVDAYNLQERE